MTIEMLENRQELMRLLYCYVGEQKKSAVTHYQKHACERLEQLFQENQAQEREGIEVPIQVQIYPELSVLEETTGQYVLSSLEQRLEERAFLVGEQGEIEAIFTLETAKQHGSYVLSLNNFCVKPHLSLDN